MPVRCISIVFLDFLPRMGSEISFASVTTRRTVRGLSNVRRRSDARVAFEPLTLRLVTLDVWQARDAISLQAPMHCRARKPLGILSAKRACRSVDAGLRAEGHKDSRPRAAACAVGRRRSSPPPPRSAPLSAAPWDRSLDPRPSPPSARITPWTRLKSPPCKPVQHPAGEQITPHPRTLPVILMTCGISSGLKGVSRSGVLDELYP